MARDKQLIKSWSQRQHGAWLKGPQDVTHPDTYEIVILHSGRSHLSIDGKYCIQTPQDICVIASGVPHSSWTEDEAIQETVVHLDKRTLEAMLSRECLNTGFYRDSRHRENGTYKSLSVAGQDAHKQHHWILSLLRNLAHLPSVPPLEDKRIERVAQALNEDMDSAWTIDSMATLATMSKAHFSRRFRAQLGTSPMQYLLKRRVERAIWLMTNKQSSFTDIAFQVGFSSSSRFSEAFVKRMGMTPNQWREESKHNLHMTNVSNELN